MNLTRGPATAPEASVTHARLSTRISAQQAGLLALLVLSALINYVDRQSTSVISPLLIRDFHLSGLQWGMVNAVFALTYIFASALGGLWIDRVGVRRGLLFATIFWSLAAAGHALAGGLAGLCLWRGLLAVGEGPGGASLLKGVRRVLPPRLQDTGTSLIGAGTLLVALVAPLLVATLAGRFGWRAAFIVTASLGALWVPVWLLLAGRRGANLEAKTLAAPPGGDEDAGDQDAPPADRLDIGSLAVWATALAVFFTVPPSVFTLSFLAPYLSQTYGLSITRLGWLQWQPFLAMDLGQLCSGAVLFFLLRRGWGFLPARRLVMTAGFLGATTMLLMTRAPTLGWVMVWLDVSRFLFQFAYVALLAYGISCVPERQAGAMNGFMNATFGLCNFLFNPLIGWMSDLYHHDYRPVFWVVGLSPVVGLGCWVLLSHLHAVQRGARGVRD